MTAYIGNFISNSKLVKSSSSYTLNDNETLATSKAVDDLRKDINSKIEYSIPPKFGPLASTQNVISTNVLNAQQDRIMLFIGGSIQTPGVNFTYSAETGQIVLNVSPGAATNYVVFFTGIISVEPAATVEWNNVTGKPTYFSPSAHIHDGRYYTKAEIDAKFAAL